MRVRSLTGLLAVPLLLASPAAAADQAGIDFFERKIRPVLVEHFYACHSETAKKLGCGLLLDSRDGLRKRGDSGPALVPGHSDRSLLITPLRSTHEHIR